jgi:protocatechuate 3,4-dioxygenase beta subunit
MTPVADGVQLDLTITLVDVNNACMPLTNHAIYLWHCDAGGLYSLYATSDSNYCRGVQITDDMGQVTFTTIFPACYDGRWPHMHFEVFASPEAAVNGDASLLTSQFAFPADVAQALYAVDPRYSASVANLGQVSIAGDMVFGDNTAEQLGAMTLTLTGDPAGYVASGTVGIAI